MPEGTVFDDDLPAIARLGPALLGALRQATSTAADGSVVLQVDSG